MKDSSKVFAERHVKGMVIYLKGSNGTSRYIMLHRSNPDLFHFLQEGKTIDSIYRYKPTRNKRHQKLYDALRHVVRVAAWVEKYEQAA